MVIEKELREAYRKSKAQLDSMSAFELMEDAGLFIKDLRKLVNSQRLPYAIIVGCLMQEVHSLNAEPSDMLLDNKLMESFKLFQKYVDREFMEKEQL